MAAGRRVGGDDGGSDVTCRVRGVDAAKRNTRAKYWRWQRRRSASLHAAASAVWLSTLTRGGGDRFA